MKETDCGTTTNKRSPWSRVFLEKLIVTQLVKKCSSFHGTWRFITIFTRARSWSLSLVRCIFIFQTLRPNPSPCVTFCNKLFLFFFFFTVNCYPLAKLPSCRTIPRRLSATAYSIYSQLPAISGGRVLHPQPEDAP